MDETLTPMKAIRKKCLDCVCGSSKEVKLCPCDDCPLYVYRTGRMPNRKPRGPMSPAQAAALEKAREARKAKK